MRKIVCVIATIIILLVVIIVIYSPNDNYATIDLGFTEQITLIGRHSDAKVTVTSQNDIQNIILTIQNGTTTWPRDLDTMVGCPFDVTLVFEGNVRKVYVSPATDGCAPIAIDGRLFSIDGISKTTLFELIKKYIDF